MSKEQFKFENIDWVKDKLAESEKEYNTLISNKLSPEERKSKYLWSVFIFAIGFILLIIIPIVWLSLLIYLPAAFYFIYVGDKLSKDSHFDFKIMVAEDRVAFYRNLVDNHKSENDGN